MTAVIASLRYCVTLRQMRGILQSWGLDGSKDVDSSMYCASLDLVAAAALARATIGA